jgi:hypothetical protein
MATLNEQMDSLIEENSKLKNDLNRSNSILNEILTSSLYKDEKIRKLEKENLELKKKVEFFNNNPTQLNSNFDLNDYSQASEVIN